MWGPALHLANGPYTDKNTRKITKLIFTGVGSDEWYSWDLYIGPDN